MKNIFIDKWQGTGNRKFRNKIPKLSGELRKSLILKLMKFCEHEIKDGKIMFKFHRGSIHTKREYKNITSWTTNFQIAERFAQQYAELLNKPAYVESTWFSEDQIHSIVFFFKNTDEDSNLWNDELEVLISPLEL